MKFNYIECPECKNKIITEMMVCGTPCSCGKTLYNDTDDNRKDVRKEWKNDAWAFADCFKDFEKRMKSAEKYWNDYNLWVKYKIVEIPDKKIIEMIN